MLAALQCARSDFFVNQAWAIDWHRFVAGTVMQPYQDRVGMLPYLRWAGHNAWVALCLTKYGQMTFWEARYQEPMSVEKFASLLAGVVSVLALLAFCVAYGRKRLRLWWLPSVFMLLILMVSLDVRSEHNVWTPYDLPHACLFGAAAICALEGQWAAMLLLFAVDVPVRETALFLVAVFLPLGLRGGKRRTLIMAALMLAYWVGWRLLEHRWFGHNPSDVASYHANNLHELLYPHHWPQIFSLGAYLVPFLILERKRLAERPRWLLFASLACMPVVAYYGVWGETRIWLEWTLPWAVLAAMEAEDFIYEIRDKSAGIYQGILR